MMASEEVWQGSSLGALARNRSRTWGNGRVCVTTGCRTQLSQYNPETACWAHQQRDLVLYNWLR